MSLFQRIKTPFRDGADNTEWQAYVPPDPVGAALRERREELGLTLVDIGDMLRIKPVYLAALEQGRAEDLPGPTYAIGFIRAYAQYLGLDGERILERYKSESGQIQARPDLSLPAPLGARSLPGGAILLTGLILALCGYGTWYYLATGERSRPERVAAVPADLREIVQDAPARLSSGLAPADAVLAPGGAAGGGVDRGMVASPASAAVQPGRVPAPDPNPVQAAAPAPSSAVVVAPPVPPPAPAAQAAAATAVALPATAKPAAPPIPAAMPAASAVVDIRALSDCWIQVRGADEQTIVFSRVLKAGETYHVPRPGLFLRTGNAGALAIVVDGKPAPAIGGIGTLRRNVDLDPQALLAGTAVRG